MLSPASPNLCQNRSVFVFQSLSLSLSLSLSRGSLCVQARLQGEGFTHNPRRQGKDAAGDAAALLVPQPEPETVAWLRTSGAKADGS